MKSVKKVLAFLFVMQILLLNTSLSFANEDTNYEESVVLYKLGLFKGTSTAEFTPSLDSSLDKGDALLLLARFFSWDLDSTSDQEIPFTDVKDHQLKAVKYAYANEILYGINDTQMGQELTMRALITLVLRELDYDGKKAWDNTETLANEAGIITKDETIPFSESIKRDNAVGIFYTTLSATPKDSKKTVLEELIEQKHVKEDTAASLGLVEKPKVEKPSSESSSGNNHTQTPKLTKVTINTDKTNLSAIDETAELTLIGSLSNNKKANLSNATINYEIVEGDKTLIDVINNGATAVLTVKKLPSNNEIMKIKAVATLKGRTVTSNVLEIIINANLINNIPELDVNKTRLGIIDYKDENDNIVNTAVAIRLEFNKDVISNDDDLNSFGKDIKVNIDNVDLTYLTDYKMNQYNDGTQNVSNIYVIELLGTYKDCETGILTLKVQGANYIQDEDGNKLKDFERMFDLAQNPDFVQN